MDVTLTEQIKLRNKTVRCKLSQHNAGLVYI